jgi:hypothetical protein
MVEATIETAATGATGIVVIGTERWRHRGAGDNPVG